MSERQSISEYFEEVFMEHVIENTPRDIEPVKCANQIVVVIIIYMLKIKKLERSL